MDYSKYRKRAFFHTNRTHWKNKKVSQYSMHPLESKRCGKSKPVNLYPSTVCLEDVDTFFIARDRNKILREVKKRINECRDMTDVRRTVYGGLCGEVKSLNNHKFAEKWSEQSSNWVKAEFPITFPPGDYYKYMQGHCEDQSILEHSESYQMYLKKSEFTGWFYVEEYSEYNDLIPFNHAEKAIMLGSDEPTPYPKWEIYVLNPTYIPN